MRHFLSLSLFLHFSLSSSAQQFTSPYRLSATVDIPLSSCSALLLLSSYGVGTTWKIPPKETLLTLEVDNINKFDRSAIHQYSKTCAYISDATVYASLLLPLIELGNRNSRNDFGKIATMSAETFVLNLAITDMFKETIRRKRPLLYDPDIPVDKKYKKDNFKSFFSGHTSTVASMSFLFAETFAKYNPGSKARPVVWSLCAAFPVLTGVMRYKAGKHFWTDIITGYAVGTLVGIAVPYLHKPGLVNGKQ